MLIIFCGDDTIASRQAFVSFKKEYQKKDYEIKEIKQNELTNTFYEIRNNSPLFHKSIAFFTENLLKNKRSKILDSILKDIANDDKNFVLVNWEDERVNKLSLPRKTIFKEYKPEKNIFKLLDQCYPGNKKKFIQTLKSVSEITNDNFIFFMLIKRIKQLILILLDKKLEKLANWQYYQLKKQASFWTLNKLINFYEQLYRIDLKNKTSNNPFSVKESMEIIACYLL